MKTFTFVIVVCLSVLSYCDSIVVDGKTYTDVYVREGSSMYYVCIPSDGTIINVEKAKVKEGDLAISQDLAQRLALKAQFDENRAPIKAETERKAAAAAANRIASEKASQDEVKENARQAEAPRALERTRQEAAAANKSAEEGESHSLVSDVARAMAAAAAEANGIVEEGEALLAQLSGGDPKKQKQLIDQAKDFALSGGGRGTTWSEQYGDAIYSILLMESSGVNTEENRNMFAALRPVIPGSPGELAKIALRYQRVFGEKEAGSLSQIISKALVVTKMGGGEVPAVLQAASNAGVVIVSRGLKWTDEEVLAAIGSISKPMGGPEKAGKALEYIAAMTPRR